MPQTPSAKNAIVREVPATFDRCIQPLKNHENIDVGVAVEQHQAYCRALESAGLTLTRVPADDRFPDCCFVEDPALVIGDLRLITRMGAPSRRGEGEGLAGHLGWGQEVARMREPATLEGGDVLVIDRRVYVGRTDRTNEAGITALWELAGRAGYEVVPVKMGNILHLKSVVAHLGEGLLVVAPGGWDASLFDAYERIEVPAAESYAANCRAVNDLVLIPAGHPRTREAIAAAGLETVEVATTEFAKAGGGVSCLSIVY
jgi:dimethylargininase